MVTEPHAHHQAFEALGSACGEAEWRGVLAEHGDLRRPKVLRELCGHVAHTIGVDLERAERLASAARWLAGETGDAASRALTARAAANVLHSAGRSEDAAELYSEALERFQGLGDGLEAAITRSSALLNLAYLGRFETAFRWAAEARQAFEEAGDRSRLAILEHNLGNLLSRQDRWQEAVDSYHRSLEAFESLGRFEEAAICLRNVAVCEIHLHRFQEALDVYERSRRLCRENGLTRVALQVDYNVAYLYFLRGEYTRALKLFAETRSRCEAEGDEVHQALCDLDQAEIYLELNLAEESVHLARGAVAAFDRLKRHYERAKARTFLALGLGRAGQVAEALGLLDEARDIFLQEDNRLWPALVDFYRAHLLFSDGQLARAQELAERAREVFAAAAAAPRAALCELLLAELFLEGDRPADARLACTAALRRLEPLDLPALEHRALLMLGRLEEVAGDRQAALEAYGRSLDRQERLRSGLQGEDLKIAFTKDKQAVYESLIWLTLRPGRETENGAPRRAFELMEKAKSRGLADLMAFRAQELPVRPGGDPRPMERVRALREELSSFYRQMDLVQMSDGEDVSTEVDRLRRGARDKEAELLRALRELQSADRELSSLQGGHTVAPELIEASLGQEAALVQYFIARDHVFATVVDRDGLEVHELGPARRTRQIHRLLRLQLSRMALEGVLQRGMTDQIAQATDAHLAELYGHLVDPLRQRLEGRRHLVFSPHGFLHFIPFHALMDQGRPLIEDFSVSYAPSGGVFHLCATKEGRWRERSLVLGQPDERAPTIQQEVEAVAEALPSSTLLTGEEATLVALSQGNDSRFIHIASHGLFRRDNPMFSAIQLGGSRLSLFDLYQLRLEAELVVLSGCGTGLSAVVGSDELVGLTRGLLFAGAQSALVTLWDVNDESTTTFMETFYRHLGRSRQRARALQKTMLAMRETHPQSYFWAPFVLVGQPAAPASEGNLG